MNSKLIINISILLLNILVVLSIDDDFKEQPKECKVAVSQMDSIIDQLGECTDAKWQPLVPKTFLGQILPTGFPKLHLLPNGSVKGMVSGAAGMLYNISSSLISTNLSDPVPAFFKKLIPKSLSSKSTILSRGKSKKSYSELKLNERVCCLLYENICVRNKVYRKNCKTSADFRTEIQQMYDKLLESCAENSLYIEESFCAEQKTKSIGGNSTCDQYLPCSQKEVFAVYEGNSCQPIVSKLLAFIWISIVFINFILQ